MLTRALVILATLALCMSAPASAQIMPVSELKPGMKGIGRSVFHGTRIEEFPVTILGTVRRGLGSGQMILIRVDGGVVTKRKTSIIAGMSGSPVYVNGRMIGAIAYGWGFAKEPIGGVTPIEAMLNELPGQPPTGEADLSLPITVSGRTYRRVAVRSHAWSGPPPADTMVVQPMNGLLQARGFEGTGLERLKKVFGDHLTIPVSSVVSSPPPGASVPAQMKPGASIGVQLVRGDLELAGSGTLTWVDGKRFLAFGHPMMQLGSVQMPFTATWVHDIMPSTNNSFKLTSQLGVIGTLSNDATCSVGGFLGAAPPMVPVTIKVQGPTGKPKTLKMEVVRHPLLTAQMVAIAATVAVEPWTPSVGDAVATIQYDLRTTRGDVVKLADTESSASVGPAIGDQVVGNLATLLRNDFEPMQLTRVDLNVKLAHGRRTAVIDRVLLDKPSYEPGDTVHLDVQLVPFQGKPVLKNFTFQIPPDLEDASFKIMVGGGRDALALRKRLALSTPRPLNREGVVRLLETQDKSTDLVALVVFTSTGAALGETRYTFLPTSLRDVVAGIGSSLVKGENDALFLRESTPWVVRGTELLSVGGERNRRPSLRPLDVSTEDPIELEVPPPSAPAPRLPAPTAKASPTPAPKASADPPPRVVPTATGRWDLDDAAQMVRGQFDGVAVQFNGELVPGPQIDVEQSFSGDVVWSLLPGAQGVVVGTGPPARIHRPGKAPIQLPAIAVHALAAGPDGVIYAATAGPSLLVAIQPDGATKRVAEFSEGYVWALHPQGPDLLVGTGLPGRLYRIDPQGRKTLLAETGELHIRSIVSGKDGIWLGTGNRGALLHHANGAVASVLNSGYGSIDALLLQGDELHIGSGSTVLVHNLKSRQTVRTLTLPTSPILAMAAVGGDVFVGTANGRIFRVQGDSAALIVDRKAGPIMALAGAPGRTLLAGVSTPAEVCRVGPAVGRGTYESPVLDAGKTSLWGMLRLQTSGKVGVETRSGQTVRPDSGWSPWIAAAPGQRVASPPGRYLQVRLTLDGASSKASSLTVFYRGERRVPRVTLVEPRASEYWSSERTVRWRLEEGERADLAFDVRYSADDGKTWKAIKAGIRPSLKPRELSSRDRENDTPDSVTWNTKEVSDGRYLLEVTARDLASDAPPARSATRVVVVSNEKPKLRLDGPRVEAGRVTLSGRATSGPAPIVEVASRIEGGEWHAAVPVDGLLDSSDEAFRLEEPAPPSGSGTLEVRTVDEAGNTITEKVKF